MRSSPRPLANAGLQINAKEAVRQLFEQRQKQICRTRSPERPDLKLSKEEALGWLLAYACGRRLLETEARPIGKLAGERASARKQECDAVRSAAGKKRARGIRAAYLLRLDGSVQRRRRPRPSREAAALRLHSHSLMLAAPCKFVHRIGVSYVEMSLPQVPLIGEVIMR